MRRLAFLFCCFASACSPGSHAAPASSSPSPTPSPSATPTPAAFSGALVGGTGTTPGFIEGVRWRTATLDGITDAQGRFSWMPNETVTFRVADVEFAPVAGAALVSPWQLAGGECAPGATLTRALVLLQSLDADGDPANGIAIGDAPAGASSRTIANLSDADIAALVSQLVPGRAPVAAAVAIPAFIRQMDGEDWEQTGSDDFPGTTGLTRSQGAASDGASIVFSWKLGLERTDLGYATQKSNLFAIPAAQSALGDNHIGDIDLWSGTLYVPLEDGSAYQHPFLATYDLATLTATSVVAVPTTLMTAGVPWVAVDGTRGVAYIAEWDPTPEIFVFDLATLTYRASIPLDVTLGRIQGAKVFEGALYVSADDANKTISKIDLDTGTVIPLFSFHATFEEEGLVFFPGADGAAMHTLNVNAASNGSEFRHHRRTRDPLRKSVCPL